MRNSFGSNKPVWFGLFFIPVFLSWLILRSEIPYSFSQYFTSYSLGLFLFVFALYYLAFRLPDRYALLSALGLTLLFLALTLSYKWTSGYSDNKVILGFLPYKDGAGYYQGANLILNGLPLENALQAGWRPLFPGFLSSMLLILDGNLKWTLVILVAFAGIGAYSASIQVFARWGALPASLFLTFLYFYIQPLVGLTMTELLGFTIGCLAFSFLWQVSHHLNLPDLVVGLFVLVLALSVRAGTFFMLPLLALWAGWVFRGNGRFSWKVFTIAMLTIALGYVAANTIYVRLIGVPKGIAFGNFAYSLYGQVHGGAGWHYAIEQLGTRDPSIIYREALHFFLRHPFSLLIGILKSYRDFFLLGGGSIFVYDLTGRLFWTSYLLWAATIYLSVHGLVKNISSKTVQLLLAAFIGIFFSIPFLPPIDGGARFYASSVPFLFVLPAVGLVRATDGIHLNQLSRFASGRFYLHLGAAIISLLTIVTPLLIQTSSSVPQLAPGVCSTGEEFFVIESNPDSYTDLAIDNRDCGLVPDICFKDFDKNGAEKHVDDFYQKLHTMIKDSTTNVRIIPTINLVSKKFHYFYLPLDKLSNPRASGVISGCAVEIKTSTQTIYQVESVHTNGNE